MGNDKLTPYFEFINKSRYWEKKKENLDIQNYRKMLTKIPLQCPNHWCKSSHILPLLHV